MERIIYKPKIKKLFNIDNGICYIRIRGKIYFLSNTKYGSIELLRKHTNYETKTPKEFYNIIHDNYLKWCEKTKQTNEKKQAYYKQMRLVRKMNKIKELKAEIKQLESELK